jgi:hypothetical protein
MFVVTVIGALIKGKYLLLNCNKKHPKKLWSEHFSQNNMKLVANLDTVSYCYAVIEILSDNRDQIQQI